MADHPVGGDEARVEHRRGSGPLPHALHAPLHEAGIEVEERRLHHRCRYRTHRRRTGSEVAAHPLVEAELGVLLACLSGEVDGAVIRLERPPGLPADDWIHPPILPDALRIALTDTVTPREHDENVFVHHDQSVVDEVLALAAVGVPKLTIAEQLGLNVKTVRRWISTEGVRAPRSERCTPTACRVSETVDREAYSYLLGMYLGDGHIVHTRSTYRLEIACDPKYPGIIR